MMALSCKVEINQVPQWVYIHLAPRAQRTLLFLHGGPGWADAPVAHLICQKLWKNFNIVHWDQRGTNRSYFEGIDPTKLSVDQLVYDGLAITCMMRDRFKLVKPILVGHSWGSMLGVLMAAEAPELFHSIVGVGQLVKNLESERISLEFCRRQAEELKKQELLSELSQMGDGFYKDIPTLFRQREILFELGGEFSQPLPLDEFRKWTDQAPPEYSTSWELMYDSCVFSMNQLWAEMIQIDLTESCQSLDIPIAILQGRQDYCTAGSVAEAWFKTLGAPSKEFVWFEESGHWPQLEENEKFSKYLLSKF